MASRVLRKLQREQEEQKRLADLYQAERGANDNEEGAEEENNDDEEEEEEDLVPAGNTRQKGNAFAFLDEADDEDAGEEDIKAEDSELEGSGKDDVDEANPAPENTSSKGKSKKKPKKKKKKKPANTEPSGPHVEIEKKQADEGLDEIDLALRSLQVKNGQKAPVAETGVVSDELKSFYGALATDSKYLNALNEMKKLFGSSVLDGETEAGPVPPRRRGRGPQQVDLGGALAGRHNPASRGQGLAGLALRKNVFMLGKEEWPKATSGGLGMEMEETFWDLTTEYRYVHNSAYQDVQKQFEACVESLDPQRMIRLLQFNPYHISTLLQVSEIAKQQGDHAVSGDLLERALFTFGRSVHSSFHTALAEGKARFDFRRPENREFWLAAWRYIGVLGQRGTWRTAYEWAKLLLSLDPEEDPYNVRMVIDQFAIRGGQFESFLRLASIDPESVVDWGQRSPNIEISSALAHYKLKHAVECRTVLDSAVRRYPWIFARLLRELNIDRIPPSIWGKEPRNEREELETASYVTRAKDVWNTPEALSLLVELVETASGPSLILPDDEIPISLNMARHTLLSDIPSLISLLPRKYTTIQTSASDPLPPEDNVQAYSTDPSGLGNTDFADDISDDSIADAQDRPSFFGNVNNLLRRFGLPMVSASDPILGAPDRGGDDAPANPRNATVESEGEEGGGDAESEWGPAGVWPEDVVRLINESDLDTDAALVRNERMRRNGDDSQMDPQRLAAERAIMAEWDQVREIRWREDPLIGALWDRRVSNGTRLLAERWTAGRGPAASNYRSWEEINGPITLPAPDFVPHPHGNDGGETSVAAAIIALAQAHGRGPSPPPPLPSSSTPSSSSAAPLSSSTTQPPLPSGPASGRRRLHTALAPRPRPTGSQGVDGRARHGSVRRGFEQS